MSMKKPENPYKKSMFGSNKSDEIINDTDTNTDTTEKIITSSTANKKIEKLKNALKKMKPESKTYSFYLETELVKKVEKLGKETNNSASTILNKILQEFFNE